MLRFITVIIVSILVGAEVDLFIPSFPELQEQFQLTPVMVQLTLSVNFIAYCICSLFAGTLGDRYNRRHIILLGLSIFVFGSLLCVAGQSYAMILLGRFLQGIGIAGPAVLTYVVIADEYPLEKQAAVLGTLNGITTFAMAFAPVIGSYVNLYCSWRGNFIILLGLGVISLIASYFFIPSKKGNPQISLSLRAYGPLLASPQLLSFVGALSLLIAAYWLFVGMAPLLYMEGFGVPLKHFGFYQGAVSLVFSTLSIISPMILQKFGQEKCFHFGKWVCVMSAILTFIILVFDLASPFIITGVMLLFAIGAVFPINIMYPLALNVVANSQARSSALILGIRLVMSAVLLEGVSYFYTGQFVPIGLTIFVAILLAFFIIRRQLKRKWLVFNNVAISS